MSAPVPSAVASVKGSAPAGLAEKTSSDRAKPSSRLASSESTGRRDQDPLGASRGAETNPDAGAGGRGGLDDSATVKADGSGVGTKGGYGGQGGPGPLSYELELAAWLTRYKRYPDLARRRGLEGTTSVRVAIRRDGSVISAGLQASSPYDVLNDAALAMVHRADPFPPMPNDVTGERFEFVVPVTFRLD